MGNQVPKNNVQEKYQEHKSEDQTQSQITKTNKSINNSLIKKQQSKQKSFFQNISNFNEGDEGHPTFVDERKEVVTAFSSTPFNKIVRVISIFLSVPVQKQRDFQFGSGVIINQRLVLTVAHTIWQKNRNLTPDYVFVEVEINHGEKALIRARKFGIHKKYFNLGGPDREDHDIAILILEKNDIIKLNMMMKMKTNFNLKEQKTKPLIIGGYPKDKNQHDEQKPFTQWQSKMQIKEVDQTKSFISYKNQTTAGQSGSPICTRYQQKGHSDYMMIGLHKASKPNYVNTSCQDQFYLSYGILTTIQNNKEIIKIARSLSINNENVDQLKDKHTKTDQLQTKIQNSPNSTLSQFKELNQINWKFLRREADSLNSFVCHKDQDSFSNSLDKIQKCFHNFISSACSNSLLSLFVAKSMFQRFHKLSFSTQEQRTYFDIIQEFIEVSLDRQKFANQLEFCGRIGEDLCRLQSKLYFKTQQQKTIDKKTTIIKMPEDLIDKRDEILQKLKKKEFKSSVTKHNMVERHLFFYLKFKDFEAANNYIDKKSSEIRQSQNEQVLSLKADLMKLSFRWNMSKQCYLSLEIKKSINKKSIEYANILQKKGQIHRLLNEFSQAEECLKENLSIVQSLCKKDREEFDFQYAEALNHLSSYYIDIGDINQAKNKLNEAVMIAQKKKGENSVELVKYLTNLATVHFQRFEYSKSLQLSKRSLTILEQNFGQNCFESIQTLNNIGCIYKCMNKTKEALLSYERCLKIEENHRGKQSRFYASILSNIGQIHLVMGKLKESQQHLEKSIQIYERCEAKNGLERAYVLFNQASLYEKLGDKLMAGRLAKESQSLVIEQSKCPNHKLAKFSKQLRQRCVEI